MPKPRIYIRRRPRRRQWIELLVSVPGVRATATVGAPLAPQTLSTLVALAEHVARGFTHGNQ